MGLVLAETAGRTWPAAAGAQPLASVASGAAVRVGPWVLLKAAVGVIVGAARVSVPAGAAVTVSTGGRVANGALVVAPPQADRVNAAHKLSARIW
jgi:hypothetical protein